MSITLPLNAVVLGYLDQMAVAGLYGRDREEVAARLIDEGIRRKLAVSGIKVAVFAIAPPRSIEAPGAVRPADAGATDPSGEPVAATAGASSSSGSSSEVEREPSKLVEGVRLPSPAPVFATAGASPTSSAGALERGATPPPAADPKEAKRAAAREKAKAELLARRAPPADGKRMCARAGCTRAIRSDNKSGVCTQTPKCGGVKHLTTPRAKPSAREQKSPASPEEPSRRRAI